MPESPDLRCDRFVEIKLLAVKHSNMLWIILSNIFPNIGNKEIGL